MCGFHFWFSFSLQKLWVWCQPKGLFTEGSLWTARVGYRHRANHCRSGACKRGLRSTDSPPEKRVPAWPASISKALQWSSRAVTTPGCGKFTSPAVYQALSDVIAIFTCGGGQGDEQESTGQVPLCPLGGRGGGACAGRSGFCVLTSSWGLLTTNIC